MNKISLKNFRCFLDVQDVRIAPLTLLVGENSSGKTSFMAMIRALWDVAYGHKVPDFKEEPFDLGSFDEIAHHRGARGSRAETIVAEFEWTHKIRSGVRERFDTTDPLRLSVTFEKRAEAPYPVQRRLESGELWIEEHFGGTNWRAAFGTGHGSWKYSDEHMSRRWNIEQQRDFLPVMWWRYIARDDLAEKLTALKNSPKLCVTEIERLERLAMYLVPFQSRPPYAGAPVRSKPRRTYDPGRSVDDPEGDCIPMFLADMSVSDKSQWSDLKGALEKFGKSSGLFDEIIIKHFGKEGSAPFRMGIIYGNAQTTLDREATQFRLPSSSDSVVPPCGTALDDRLRKAIWRRGHAHILFQIAFSGLIRAVKRVVVAEQLCPGAVLPCHPSSLPTCFTNVVNV